MQPDWERAGSGLPRLGLELPREKLRSIDLSSENDSVQERKLRLRLLKLEPGGVVGMHSHKDRPTVLHVIKGTLTSHLQGKPEVREPLAQRGAAARVVVPVLDGCSKQMTRQIRFGYRVDM